ncbi:MAG TPA: response regulator [Bdellovibrionales bacterium]|nr:response regulator [Bdellovibrionales bacterium]
MALRVLLADESTTIKKVMQLALQDFAIEVKAVHVGVDVLEVARSFQPDLIFADILLQKKNGYEVCADLKADAKLKSIPVVLMWSSFMEFDEALAVKNKADGRLEKPFDVETLRKVVLQLVPKTHTQRLAHFLEFSDKVTEPMRAELANQKPAAAAPAPPAPKAAPKIEPEPEPIPPHLEEPVTTSSWNIDSFEDVDLDKDGFAPVNLAPKTEAPKSDDGEPWSHQDLSRFKIDLPPVSVASDDMEIKIDLGEEEFGVPTAKRPKPPSVEMEPRAASDETFAADFSMPDIPVFDEPIEAVQFEVEALEDETAEPPTPIEPLRLDDHEPEPGNDSLEIEETTLNIPNQGAIPQMDADRLEEIIRAQSRDIIEAVVRKIVPDLAEKLIRAELERLIGDDDSSDEVERPRSP